jgi:hypothetical protein
VLLPPDSAVVILGDLPVRGRVMSHSIPVAMIVSRYPPPHSMICLTRGSAITPGVCVCTTRSMKRMQLILTPGCSESIRLRTLDLIADMVCHGSPFCGFLILCTECGQENVRDRTIRESIDKVLRRNRQRTCGVQESRCRCRRLSSCAGGPGQREQLTYV